MFVWDTDTRIHGTLIGVNVLLLVSLILRFEWPLIKKRFTSSAEDNIENNIENNTNGLNKMTIHSLPSTRNISDIQLTKIESGHNVAVEEEKYIIECEIASDSKSSNRRRESIEFYRELFNIENFDHNGKLLTAKKRKKRRNKVTKKKKRISHRNRNDSINLREHERSFNDINDINDDIDIDTNVHNISLQTTYVLDHNYDYDSNTNINIAQILNSKIYDDCDKKSVRFRYRYILYLPPIIFVVFGITCLILSSLSDGIELYLYINYGYPLLSIILSIVLWCEIDIVILSCGGAHIVEECLEVQISANGDEYKCIYCCWCDCAVLRFCNSCTHDNGFSLFKCHHILMKILICLICPLLIILFFIISEIPEINHVLTMTKIGDIHNINFNNLHNRSLYPLIFIIISVLYLIFLFTATYIGILIVKSLHFVSSLSAKTLSLQYITSIIITFIMQIQFVVLLSYYNVSSVDSDGLLSPTPFFMVLVYIEFIISGIINHFSFRNNDFVRFGREAIEKNEVQLFDFQPDFDSIHDLHNYRRVYGERFLWEMDHKNVTLRISPEIDCEPRQNEYHDEEEVKTPLITGRGIITIDDSSHRKSKKSSKKHINDDVASIELESVIDESKETQHNHPTTTTSLSLDINHHYLDSSSSNHSWNHKANNKNKTKLQHVDSEKP